MFLCSGLLYEWVFSQSPESVIRASMKPAQVSLHNANEEEKTPGGSRKDIIVIVVEIFQVSVLYYEYFNFGKLLLLLLYIPKRNIAHFY